MSYYFPVTVPTVAWLLKQGRVDNETFRYFAEAESASFSQAEFNLPSGTPISACRSGTVLQVRDDPQSYRFAALPQKRYRSRLDEDPAHKTNLVVIGHEDGTQAEYVHVLPFVESGASVEAGDVLGILYGYVYEEHPHLHLRFSRPHSWFGRLGVRAPYPVLLRPNPRSE